MYSQAVLLNHKNIFNILDRQKDAYFLDLGCDDGELTKKIGEKIDTNILYGVEIVTESIEKAQKKGIIVKKFDLNDKFDFEDNFFDVIHANQVIEHIYNSDNFLSETYRVLKRGGYMIISTENASSWCNILASVMGWQIFSLTNISNKRQGIGNPFSLHRGDHSGLESWNHIRIYNIRGLREYLEVFGFKIEKIQGAGYFPLPSVLGNIDKIHSHFIAFKVRK